MQYDNNLFIIKLLMKKIWFQGAEIKCNFTWITWQSKQINNNLFIYKQFCLFYQWDISNDYFIAFSEQRNSSYA